MRATFTGPKVIVSAQIDREQREALHRMAAAENRTLSAVVRRALSEWLTSSDDRFEDAGRGGKRSHS